MRLSEARHDREALAFLLGFVAVIGIVSLFVELAGGGTLTRIALACGGSWIWATCMRSADRLLGPGEPDGADGGEFNAAGEDRG